MLTASRESLPSFSCSLARLLTSDFGLLFNSGISPLGINTPQCSPAPSPAPHGPLCLKPTTELSSPGEVALIGECQIKPCQNIGQMGAGLLGRIWLEVERERVTDLLVKRITL